MLAACGAPPPAPLLQQAHQQQQQQQDFADIRRIEGGALHGIDAARSALRIHVFRAGRAANLGHNHVLAVPALQGLLWLPAQGTREARFELAFRLDQLLIDPPELRAALGPAWASPMSPEAIAATRTNMLGAGNLQADTYPWVRIR